MDESGSCGASRRGATDLLRATGEARWAGAGGAAPLQGLPAVTACSTFTHYAIPCVSLAFIMQVATGRVGVGEIRCLCRSALPGPASPRPPAPAAAGTRGKPHAAAAATAAASSAAEQSSACGTQETAAERCIIKKHLAAEGPSGSAPKVPQASPGHTQPPAGPPGACNTTLQAQLLASEAAAAAGATSAAAAASVSEPMPQQAPEPGPAPGAPLPALGLLPPGTLLLELPLQLPSSLWARNSWEVRGWLAAARRPAVVVLGAAVPLGGCGVQGCVGRTWCRDVQGQEQQVKVDKGARGWKVDSGRG